MDDEGRDQLFKADASDEGCLNIHLLITQTESVCFPYDEDSLGTDSVKYLQVWIWQGRGARKKRKDFKKSAKDEIRYLVSHP